MLGFSKKNDEKAAGGFGLPSLSFGKVDKALGQGIVQAGNTLKNTGEKVDDFLFGHSKNQNDKNAVLPKNDGKAAGGFGLPSLSFGKVDKALGQGIGQAGNTLKNTGEKVDDFLFGHSKNQNDKNAVLPKNDEKAAGGFGLPSLSFGKVDKALGQGIGQAGNTLKNTGEKVDDFLFGHSKNQNDKNAVLPRNDGKASGSFGLPSLSFGKVDKALGQGIGQAANTLKNTGKKVDDFLFGHAKNQNNTNAISAGAPGFGSISLNTGNLISGSSYLTGTVNEIDRGLNKTGNHLKKTGEKTLDYLFGNNKNKQKAATGKLNLPAPKLPGSFFAGANISDIEKKIDKDIGSVDDGVQKTGKKVVDYIFGKGNKTQAVSTELSLGGNDLNLRLGGDSGHLGKNTKPTFTNLSLEGSNNMLGETDVENKVNNSSKSVSNGLEKTGEKVVDILFGGKNPKLPSVSPSGGIASTTGAMNATKNLHTGSGKIQGGLQNTGGKVVDYLFGGKSNRTVQSGIDLEGKFVEGGLKQINDKLPDQSGNLEFLQNPNNTGANGSITIPNKMKEDIPKLDISEAKTGGRVIDSLFGGSNANPTNAPHEEDKTYKSYTSTSLSSFPLDATTPSIASNSEGISNIKLSSGTDTEYTTVNDLPVYSEITNINSFQESTTEAIGISEMPNNQSTQSEETLRKIENILQGSGQLTTEASLKTDLNFDKKVEEGSKNTNTKFHEDSTTVRQNTLLDTVFGKSTTPVEQNPFFLLSNNTKATEEQFTPELPPSIFDKPTGGKAPFIPILPPPMESTVRNIITPLPTVTSRTLSPPITSAASRTLTPVEYGAIGIGGVLIFALLAYIYQKYRQFRTSSTGGSYSPKAHHRNTAGRKRSTRSNDSEGGQPLDVNETDKTMITQSTMNGINSEVVVVEIAPDFQRTDEVVEMPVTRTVVNGLQKSSTSHYQVPPYTSENCEDSIEKISEKPNSTIDKPPRKTKTPSNSPEKFTSDKTSASQLNGDSLKTVSHAIGGILRSQVPNKEETEKQTSYQEPDSSGSYSGKNENSLGGRNSPLSSTKAPENISESDTLEEPNLNKDIRVTQQTNHSAPLTASLDTEVDAGSEYFSADENSESKNSPPPSPSLEHQFKNCKSKNLRAENVYNTEIITEDGRRMSIEEDIAESINRKLCANFLDTTIVALSAEKKDNIENEALITGEDLPYAEVASGDEYIKRNDSGQPNGIETHANVLPGKIHRENLINTEKSNTQQYQDKKAEEIVDDILRASQLDSLAVPSIRQDLGDSPVVKPKVTWSDSIEVSEIMKDDPVITDVEVDKDINTEEDKPQIPNYAGYILKNDINTVLNCNNKMKKDIEHAELDDFKSQHMTNTGYEINEKNILINAERERQSPNVKGSTSAKINNETICIENLENQIDLVDEGFPEEHKFEFIPPRRPEVYEDDMIVFSNSDRESISTLSTSTAESNRQNEEHLSTKNRKEEITATNPNYNICEECGGIQDEELVTDKFKTLDSINTKETEDQQTRTKWYVPNDETTDLKINAEESLYIVTSDNAVKAPHHANSVATEILVSSNGVNKISPGRSNRESKYSSNISYAYLEVTDDPRNEGWPGHLPKNIHSISGVGLIKTVDDVLKEEELETQPSTSMDTKCGENNIDGNGSSSSNDTNKKPIPKFIIPNMDARLTKKRSSRRRQIKSLDSGVHHYYGEYLNLAEFPDIETEDAGEKIEKVIEDVITIKPDGTITEEKIIIQNSK